MSSWQRRPDHPLIGSKIIEVTIDTGSKEDPDLNVWSFVIETPDGRRFTANPWAWADQAGIEFDEITA